MEEPVKQKQKNPIGKQRADYDRRRIRTAMNICAVLAVMAVCAQVYVIWSGVTVKRRYEQLAVNSVFEAVTALPIGDGEEDAPAQMAARDGSDAMLTVDFEQLLSMNSDTVAWLHVPMADVSYPVVYSPEDNNYYLHRAFDGTNSAAGSIYLEYTNAPDFTDRHSLIYGHNMNDGSMFGSLQKVFREEGIYNTEPYFYLYLPDGGINCYRVFSFYETDKDSDTYLTFTEDNAYDWYVYYARTVSEAGAETDNDNPILSSGIFLSRPPIVTLSTCSGPVGTSKRFVVHGILTDHPER